MSQNITAGTRRISRFNAFLMLCLITFWGSSFVVVKIVLNEGVTPIAIATYRFLTAGVLFLIALLANRIRNKQHPLRIRARDLPTILLLSVTGVTFFFIIQYTGIQLGGASIAAILVCLLSPILITAFSARIFKEHLMKRQAAGIGMAALGTFTVVTGGSMIFQGNSEFLLGSLILLLTPFLWATYTLSGKRIMQKYSPFLVVSYVNVIGGLLLVPFSLAENSFTSALALSIYSWLAILFLAVTCSVLGYFIWFHVMKQVDAAVASSFLFAEPLITALLAVSFVGEKITAFTIIGGMLIFAGVFLATRK